MTNPSVLLEADDLHIAYGRVEAVRGVSLEIVHGQIVTIIGPNGAGKSTLLNGLMGLIPATGRLSFFGNAQRHPGCEELVARGVTLIPERRDLFGPLSIADNLQLGAFARYRRGERDHLATLDEVFELFPRLHERRNQAAGTLSGGERQMLALGRALMAKPRLLLMDEPGLGLAPLIVRDIFRVIAGLRARGVACLLVEQNARAALQVADYAYVMESGRFVLQGTAGELAEDPKVIESYLGLRRAATG
jgi:branched-chain amino acid transport system ATP-binding protein